jgi:glutathione S-transferase
MELIFYTNPQSRGRMVRWMLEECGAEYRTEVIQYGPQMKSPPYTDINSMGKVPALVYEGKVVTECAAIIAFLAELFPDKSLAPPPTERQAWYRWLFFAAGPLEAAVTNNSLGLMIPPERQGMAGYGNYELVLDTLEQAVSGSAYLCGDTFTAADVYLGSHIGWGLQFGTLPGREAYKAYFARISERPARLRASALDDALMTPAG